MRRRKAYKNSAITLCLLRSIRLTVFCKKGVFENYQNAQKKHLCQSLFFNKVADLRNCIKKEAVAQVFSCEICKIFKNIFFHRAPPVAASVYYKYSFITSSLCERYK